MNRFSLTNKPPMRLLHVCLVYHRIMHRGIDLGMTQKLLHLLNGHALVYGEGGEGPAEFVGMDAGVSNRRPSWRRRISTPLILSRAWGCWRVTNSAGFSSLRSSR